MGYINTGNNIIVPHCCWEMYAVELPRCFQTSPHIYVSFFYFEKLQLLDWVDSVCSDTLPVDEFFSHKFQNTNSHYDQTQSQTEKYLQICQETI